MNSDIEVLCQSTSRCPLRLSAKEQEDIFCVTYINRVTFRDPFTVVCHQSFCPAICLFITLSCIGQNTIAQYTFYCQHDVSYTIFITVSTFSGTDINRNMPQLRVPNIYEGVQSEEEKRRARSQQAMYRRLFMDIEREQVKENLRRQEHRKRIVK